MKKLILLNLLSACFTICFAQSGELDPTFGNQGIVTTDMDSLYNYSYLGKQALMQTDGSLYLIAEAAGLTVITKKHPDGSTDVSYGNNGYSGTVPIYASKAALQNDGKIVVIGYALNSSYYYNNQTDYAIARFNTDGTLDDTFGKNGIQTTDTNFNEYANAVAFQSDGKIVVAGISKASSIPSFVLARYNTDGSLDDSFAEGGIQVTYVFSVSADDYVTSVAIQGDGKIVVGGSFIVRYDSDGSVDNSFNGEGYQLISGMISAMAIQNDDKILAVIGGSTLARYKTDGNPDSTFGVNGVQTLALGATDMAIQSNGKIIIAGQSTIDNGNFAIARYNTDGMPDNSFSGDGIQITGIAPGNASVNSIKIQSDEKLLVLGYTVSGANTYIAATRYDTAGNLDNSFYGDGILTTLVDPINQGSTFYTSTALQNDGKILSAGYTWNGSNYDFALARYNTDGSLDNTFSGDGKQTTDFNSANDKANAIIFQSDGKILVGGSAGDSSVIARYNTDGSPDLSFAGDGIQITDIGSPDSIISIGLQSDGKIIAGGSSLSRYTIDGAPDESFGVNGKVTPPFNCNAIAVQKDDKIIITGGGLSVARYNSDGSNDNTFNNGMPISFDFGGGGITVTGNAIAIQNDGRIVVGGTYVWSYLKATLEFVFVRLKTDGTADSTLNGNGSVAAKTYNGPLSETSGIGNAYASSVIVQNDNKIILGGYSFIGGADDFTIARFNTDGTFDSTFSNDGIVVTQVSGAFDRISGIALYNGKLYAVGYGQFPGNFGVVARYFLSEGGPLPVSLLNFTGALQNNAVRLQWEIASQKSVTSFVIERSGDGNRFLPINSVPASGVNTFTGNYSIVDEQPLQGINFYRLQLVDADGKFTYSNIVAVKMKTGIKLQIFPNPVNSVLFVEANGNNENASAQVVDVNGRKLREMTVYLNGKTSFSIDIKSLPAGMYNLILQKKDNRDVRKFIKE